MPVKSGFMKYDNTITLGNVLTIGAAVVSVSVGWGVLTTRQDALKASSDDQRREFTAALADVREAIKEQRNDTKDLQKSVNAITENTALIRGRLAGDTTPTPRK